VCRVLIIESLGNLLRCHGTVTDEVVCTGFFNFSNHRPGDFFRYVMKLLFYCIRSVMPGTPFDGFDFGVRREREKIAGFQADVLHPQMAGHLVGDLAECVLKVRFKKTVPVPEHQVFERIEHGVANFPDIFVVGKHQRQFLFEHQCAGRNRRHDVPARVDPVRQAGNAGIPRRAHSFEIGQFQFRHAAT
jgi:hypothetical protein